MITGFSVKNFRGFRERVHFDLTTDKRYEFNEHAVENGVIRHAMVYGPNGGGKTNLGYALVDVANHLAANRFTGARKESGYLNGDSDSDVAEFHYQLLLDGCQVDYKYSKTAPTQLSWEQLSFEGEVVAEWDKAALTPAIINLEGTETLNKSLTPNIISIINYISQNSALVDSRNNRIFQKLVTFFQGLVFLNTSHEGSLQGGLTIKDWKQLGEYLSAAYGVKRLQDFMLSAGVECQLDIADTLEGKRLVFAYKNTQLDFVEHASSGTFALMVLFYWLQRIRSGEYTFAYIDEFDAFYHHSLASTIARQVFESDAQVILSTHNTSIMNNDLLRPDCYFTVARETILPVYKQSDRELRKAHNLEKMYRAGAFKN